MRKIFTIEIKFWFFCWDISSMGPIKLALYWWRFFISQFDLITFFLVFQIILQKWCCKRWTFACRDLSFCLERDPPQIDIADFYFSVIWSRNCFPKGRELAFCCHFSSEGRNSAQESNCQFHKRHIRESQPNHRPTLLISCTKIGYFWLAQLCTSSAKSKRISSVFGRILVWSMPLKIWGFLRWIWPD